jgi:hypothetical protein
VLKNLFFNFSSIYQTVVEIAVSRKFIFSYALYTVINGLFSFWVVKSTFIFLVREFLFFWLLILILKFKPVISEYSKESTFISKLLKDKYPVLKAEFPLFIITFCGFIFFSYSANEPAFFLANTFLVYLCVSYAFLKAYWIYCAVNDEDISSFYDLPRKIKVHGFRSFTTLKTIGHICKLCFQGGLGLFIGVESFPKYCYDDVDQRGLFSNLMTYYGDDGIVSRSNTTMKKAGQFLHYYPMEKGLIVRDDGFTLDPLKLDEQIKLKNLQIKPFLQAEIHHNHDHSLGWPSKK